MQRKQLNDLLADNEEYKYKQKNEKMTRGQYDEALQYYDMFQDNLMKNMQNDLKQIKNALNIELARTIRKLEIKLKSGYTNSLSDSIKSFDLQGFISKETKEVYSAITHLKEKIYEYINQFSSTILKQNIQRRDEVSLFNFSNNIKSLDDNWKSVTSKCPLTKAEINVQGFNRPQTSWLALGVSKKMKQYGPVKTNLNKQDFMGNIYLNGTNDLQGGYKMKRDLVSGDNFVVICENRMVWVNRQGQSRKKSQVFIMEDNVDYYVYVAIRGPLDISFMGQ